MTAHPATGTAPASFDGVPGSVDPKAEQALLEALPGVARVHEQHVWAMGTSEIAITAHLVMTEGHAGDSFLQQATDQLHDRLDIEHVTLQIVGAPFTRPCRRESRWNGRSRVE